MHQRNCTSLYINRVLLEDFKKICAKDQIQKAFIVLQNEPNCIRVPFIFALLEACIRKRDIEVGRQLQKFVVQHRLSSNTFLASHFIRLFGLCGSLLESNQVFYSLPTQSVFTWSAIITANAKRGLWTQCIKLYSQMLSSGTMPDAYLYATALNACAHTEDLCFGRLLHAQLVESLVGRLSFQSNNVVSNTLIDMYTKCKSFADAREVFNRTMKPDEWTWSTLIAGYAQDGDHVEALELFQRMQKGDVRPGIVIWNAIIAGYVHHEFVCQALDFFQQMLQEGQEPNDVTFVCLLKVCSVQESLFWGKSVHIWIVESGLEKNLIVSNALVDMYAKIGSFNDAYTVFNKMHIRDIVTWSSIIALYVEKGDFQKAVHLFHEMQDIGIDSNPVTLVNVLRAFRGMALLSEGKVIHSQIAESGLETNIFVGSSLIDLYTQCGTLKDAHAVFNSLPKQCKVSWNAILAGYAENNDYGTCKYWFEEMRRKDLQPTISTFTSLFSACSHVGSLQDGCHYFKIMADCNIAPTVDHYNCICDLLGRVGHLTQAADLLESMPFGENMIGWKSLLGHSKMHGNVDMSKKCFDHISLIDPEHELSYTFMSDVYEESSGSQSHRLSEKHFK